MGDIEMLRYSAIYYIRDIIDMISIIAYPNIAALAIY